MFRKVSGSNQADRDTPGHAEMLIPFARVDFEFENEPFTIVRSR
jgi:hypothetical protein